MIKQVLFLACLSLSVIAMPQSRQTELPKLIPPPQQIVSQDRVFDLKTGASIILADPTNTDDQFAGKQLQDEAKQDWNIALAIKKSAKKRILIGQIGRDRAVDEALKGYSGDRPKANAFDAYILWIKPDEIVIAGYTPAGTFYGVQTLRQIIRQSSSLPCLQISDWAALQYRGWQDDVSRGPIPTLDYLKKQVRILSEYKLNCMTLYTEHIFKLKKHPTIAPADGISAEEIKELSAYAKKYHIELIGNFQSFGHFANILNVKGYENLGEAGWVLSPAKEESYQFLKDVYSEIAPAYASSLFNINCDETGGLGDGASKEMVQKMGLAAVYAQHINRIADLLRPLGKTPMMWGDIAQQHQEIVPRLPKDLIVMSWGYHAGNNFDYAILPFTKLSLRFWVCPGVSCWSQVFPDYRNASINISNYVRDGFRNGAMGMLNTTWDDDGENLFSYNWLPLIWSAECSWKPCLPAEGDWNDERDRRYSSFLAAYDPLFYGSEGKVADALVALSDLRSNPASAGMGDGGFWMGIDEVSRRDVSLAQSKKLIDDASAILSVLHETKPKLNQDSIDYALYAARRAKFMGLRAVATQLLEDAATDPTICSGAITAFKELANEAAALKSEYTRLWLDENRKWWLDRNLPRFDSLIKSLNGVLEGPTISPKRTTFEGELQVRIGSLVPGMDIRYTIDGAEPTPTSALYKEPVAISRTTTVKVRAFKNGTPAGDVIEQIYRTTPIPARITTNMHPFENNAALCAWDGDPATFFWREGPAQEGDWLKVAFTKTQSVQEITVPTGHPDGGRDQLQNGVLEASEDGKSWAYSIPFDKGTATLKLSGKPIKAYRIRVIGTQGFWLVVREMTVR